MGIRVTDMAAVKRCLAASKVDSVATADGRVLVPAAAACNVLIEFSA